MAPTWFTGSNVDSVLATAFAAPIFKNVDMTEKEHLREQARRHRAYLTPHEDDHEKVCASFFQHFPPSKEDILALYWPMPREFDPRMIIETAIEHGIRCALPVVMRDSKIMRFSLFDGDTRLVQGVCKTMEPPSREWIDPDIVIVPLLAFDRRGGRLGQGGGYYDATLRDLRARKDITAVGVAYTEQVCLFSLPMEEHDERLDAVITPQDVHRFKLED